VNLGPPMSVLSPAGILSAVPIVYLLYRRQQRVPGLAAFAATRLAAAFFATFADFLDVLPAIVFTPGLRRRCVARCATWWHTAARTSTDRST
jgi:hypothetical protein